MARQAVVLVVYCSGTETMDIQARLLAAIEKSGLSERKLSIRATGGPDAVRNLRRGSVPRADNLERLCHAMGLELQLTPANEDAMPAPVRPTEFTGNRELPVYEWTDPSEKGYLRRPEEPSRAPAPSDVSDQQAFYVRMPDSSMAPAEIWKGDYCLVSPFALVQVDQRVWFRARTGRETIKWVLRLTPDGFYLGAWDLDENHHQAPAATFWKREDVVERGVVDAAYREKPTASKALDPHANWRPDSRADLWRSAQFSAPLKAIADQLNKAVSVVGKLEKDFKLVAVTGKISDSESRQVLRAIDRDLDDAKERMRMSIIENRSDTNGGTSRP